MAREHLPDLRSAQLYIIKASPGFAKKSLKQKAWQDAIANVQRDFKMLEGSRTQIRAITHATMQSLFAPMADAIARKHKHMQFLNSDMEVHKHMMQRMQTCTDTKEAQRLLEELDKLLDHSQLLAFQGKNQWGSTSWRAHIRTSMCPTRRLGHTCGSSSCAWAAARQIHA
jgi:prophage DNA circulation protein